MEKLTRYLRLLAAMLLAAKAGVDLGLSLRRAANPELDRALENDTAEDEPRGPIDVDNAPGLHIPEHLLVPERFRLVPTVPRSHMRRRRVDRGAFGVKETVEGAYGPADGPESPNYPSGPAGTD